MHIRDQVQYTKYSKQSVMGILGTGFKRQYTRNNTLGIKIRGTIPQANAEAKTSGTSILDKILETKCEDQSYEQNVWSMYKCKGTRHSEQKVEVKHWGRNSSDKKAKIKYKVTRICLHSKQWTHKHVLSVAHTSMLLLSCTQFLTLWIFIYHATYLQCK